MGEDIIVTLKRSNDLLMTFGNDYSDVFLPAIDKIERLREQCDRMASLAIDNAKDTERAMRLRKALREIYEVYANSEGIPQPMTAAEGYLLFLLKETAKIAQETLQEKE
jgi:hypothetical protein